jgi:heme/copper-type cytochrome/quinol oxidase subunit 3
METLRALSRGSQIVLVAGPLLFVSLFLTWQYVDIDYGRAGVATMSMDGWDAWGLMLALLVASVVTIVALENLTDVEFSDDIPWATVTFALGATVLAVALVKNLTDAGSSWASYGFVALAGAVAAGTFLDWRAARRKERKPVLAQKRRGLRSTA